ncbi:MAG: hypothetical protein ACRC3H_07020 [Lachnospiraceae bacterium]
MKEFYKFSRKEQNRGSEILIFMFECSDVEFQAFTGAIPMTRELFRRITTLLKNNYCYLLLQDFLNDYPDYSTTV